MNISGEGSVVHSDEPNGKNRSYAISSQALPKSRRKPYTNIYPPTPRHLARGGGDWEGQNKWH